MPWGYVQIGGALRYLAYDDLLPNDAFDLNGHNWGWGVSLSGAVKRGMTHELRPTRCTCSSSAAQASRTTSTTRRSTWAPN